MFEKFGVLLADPSVSSSMTIISLIIAFISMVLYLRHRRTIDLRIRVHDNVLVEDANSISSNIEIRSRGNVIQRLTSTKVYLWNAGKGTMRKDDIAAKDRLRIEVGAGQKIYDARVTMQNSNANNFCLRDVNAQFLSFPCSTVYVHFDFADYMQGCAISLIHDGGMDDVKLNGILIGFGGISKLQSKKYINYKENIMSAAIYFLLFPIASIGLIELSSLVNERWGVWPASMSLVFPFMVLLWMVFSLIPRIDHRRARMESGKFLESESSA